MKVGRALVLRPADTFNEELAPLMRAQGMELRGAQWVCRYGCVGYLAPSGATFHTHSCLWWQAEGKDADAPF